MLSKKFKKYFKFTRDVFKYLQPKKIQQSSSSYISKTKKKLSNLKKTNYELGIFHLENYNLNDAIFRFNLIYKFSDYRPPLLLFYMGRSYFEKKQYKKAIFYFEAFLQQKNTDFINEAKYCLNIAQDKTKDIKIIPQNIVALKNSQLHYINKNNKQKKSPDKSIYSELVKLLEQNDNLFDYGLLDQSCGMHAIAYFLKKDMLLKHAVGISSSQIVKKNCQSIRFKGNKIYKKVLCGSSDQVQKTIDGYDIKFNLLINLNLSIDYEIELFFKRALKTLESENIVLVLSLALDPDNKSTYFSRELEGFIHSQQKFQSICKKQNLSVIFEKKTIRKDMPGFEYFVILKR